MRLSMQSACDELIVIEGAIVEHRKTKFNDILVIDTVTYGRVMALDGIINSAESDEHIYHESIAHVTVGYCGKEPARVLVAGGGDGGIARELLKHPSIREITVVDIDREVTEIAENTCPHLNDCGKVFRNPRVALINQDAVAFCESCRHGQFDAVIIDGTDCWTDNGCRLYAEDGLEAFRRVLAVDGVLGTHLSESPYVGDIARANARRLAAIFGNRITTYGVPVPSYHACPLTAAVVWKGFKSRGIAPMPEGCKWITVKKALAMQEFGVDLARP